MSLHYRNITVWCFDWFRHHLWEYWDNNHNNIIFKCTSCSLKYEKLNAVHYIFVYYRSSEKRKEKSRDAARNRRSQEAEIFSQLCNALPVPSNVQAQLDKSSVMRIAISHLKLAKIIEKANDEGKMSFTLRVIFNMQEL